MPSPVRSKGAAEHVCMFASLYVYMHFKLFGTEEPNPLAEHPIRLRFVDPKCYEAKLSTRLCHVLPTQKVCCSMRILYAFACVHACHICDDSSKHFIHLTYNYTHIFEEKCIHQYRAKRFLE